MATTVQAEVPPVPNAFPRSTSYTPGQLLYRSASGKGRISNIAYHNGVIYTNNVGGDSKRTWRWTDPSNAGSLSGTDESNSFGTISEQGNHANYKTGDWIGGYYGLSIKRQSPGVNTDSQHPDWSTISASTAGTGTRIYFPWNVPFHWLQYAGVNGDYPAAIYRAGTKLYEWNPLAEEGVMGPTILFGNLLFVISDETSQGILCYDISPVFKTPAEKPILLDKLTGSYGTYLPHLWENYIVLSRGGKHSKDERVEVIDFSDPTDLKHVTTINTKGTVEKYGESSAWYIQAQDNFIFTQHQKINMNTFKVVLELDQLGNNRPSGSVAGEIDTSNYLLPLGNLLITGPYPFSGQDSLGVWAHQAEPDTKKPYVGYHMPRSGQTNYPLGAPISLLIHESLESYTIINGETIILREVSTTTPNPNPAIDCWTSFSHDDILTITPKAYLTANKTYEVVVVANGIKDPVGNGIEPYTFTFSTGSSVGGNKAPVINSFTPSASPVAVNTSVTFTASATDAESDTLAYRFHFGDGSDPTAWGTSTSVAHTYPAAGHFEAKLQVRETRADGSTSVVSKSFTVTVANAITATAPTNSSTIALDKANRRVWVANSDADTVTILSADGTNGKVSEFNLNTLLGLSTTIDPRGIAIDSSGNAWVACHDADKVVVINSNGGLVRTISPGYGSAPIGVAITPDGTSAFVTLMGKGQLKRYTVSNGAESGSLDLGPTPRAIAITGDGTRVLVTRFLADINHGMVWDVANSSTLSLNRVYRLNRDLHVDGASNGRGIVNHLTGITISPDGVYAWITGTKHNDQHGTFFTGAASTDNTARAVVVRLKLADSTENSEQLDRVDIDNSDSPTSVVFSPRGDWAFTTLQGNNEVAVFDDIALRTTPGPTSVATNNQATKWRFGADLAPQGMVFDSQTNKLFVNNFMARNVSVHALGDFLATGSRAMTPTKVSTVSSEKLNSTVLAGKQIFYNAARKNSSGQSAMSRDNYISCATCHLDGGQDGRVWDFTQRGEGLRNTIDLRGKSGMGHGNLHWTANFDEVQDFENDIRSHFGGVGLISGTTVSDPLGAQKAGQSTELDQLAAYVASLNASHIPASPHRATDGSLTTAAIAGKAVFEAQNCTSCHSGTQFTDSVGGVGVTSTLRDVGTLRTSSGKRINATLSGIDTPTLLGLHNSGPYFHDGSAPTIESVFTVAGGKTYQAEAATLSGGAATVSFIKENYSNSAHLNGLVSWSSNGTATFSQVDGGSTAGTGAIELRYATNEVQTITVTVNGTARTFSSANGMSGGWTAAPNYQTARIEGVSLNSGMSNTIVVSATPPANGGLLLDDITVSTAADLTKAQPHRRVLAVSATDRANLIAYLQQLDGQSGLTFRQPEDPANAVSGVNYDFHQFAGGLSNTDGLTSTNKVSSGTSTSTLSAVPGQNADSDDEFYGLVYTGYISVPADGVYTFYTNSDDGNKLQIGTTTVASDESPHGSRWNTDSTPIALKAGKHAFTLKFYENNGGDSLKVEYTGPNIARTELPASALYRVDGNTGGTVVDRTDEGGSLISARKSINDGENHLKAFDNTTSTKWLDDGGAPTSSAPSWIEFHFDGNGYAINRYTITSANDMSVRDPKSWRLKASNDATPNWSSATVLDSQTGQTFTPFKEKKTYDFANTTVYKKYRLEITENAGNNSMTQLSEIELLTVGGASGLPSPWVAADIGTAANQAGTSAYNSTTATWTINAGGDDIWNTSDKFHYVYQDSSGDCIIEARVTAVENTDIWAKAGIMIRESNAAGARNVIVAQKPDNEVFMHWRTATDTASTYGAGGGGTTSVKYLRLTRVGNTFTGYYKVNAGDSWTQITSVDLTMGSAAKIGLAVTAHTGTSASDTARINTSTLTNVTVTP